MARIRPGRVTGWQWTAVGLGFLWALLLPAEARADDLGVLVYLIVVWPVGIASALILAVLAIVTAIRRRRGPSGAQRSGTALAVTAVILDVVFALVAIGSEGWRGFRATEFAIGHVVAFQLVALPCLWLGLVARRPARSE